MEPQIRVFHAGGVALLREDFSLSPQFAVWAVEGQEGKSEPDEVVTIPPRDQMPDGLVAFAMQAIERVQAG